jgi:hypothetical protein
LIYLVEYINAWLLLDILNSQRSFRALVWNELVLFKDVNELIEINLAVMVHIVVIEHPLQLFEHCTVPKLNKDLLKLVNVDTSTVVHVKLEEHLLVMHILFFGLFIPDLPLTLLVILPSHDGFKLLTFARTDFSVVLCLGHLWFWALLSRQQLLLTYVDW